MPETCKTLVGNRSTPVPWHYRPVLPALNPPLKISDNAPRHPETGTKPSISPLTVLGLLKNRATLVAVVCYGVYYTIYSCLQASLSTIFVETYHITGFVAGLIYVPFGVACMVAAFIAGTWAVLQILISTQ